ncbi:unnamed protein product [Durusdinium trenchii]|uniref:Sulfotransferase family protein n=1 Tax=Durusdinium trenchii TaxID=1381693 RepID=A0ABP0L0Q6_9DINO
MTVLGKIGVGIWAEGFGGRVSHWFFVLDRTLVLLVIISSEGRWLAQLLLQTVWSKANSVGQSALQKEIRKGHMNASSPRLNLPSHGLSKPCLKFIHIPKNAGTSIEHLGKKLNLHWGEFDDSLRCRNASRCHQTLPIYRDCCWPRKTTACSLWHYPPSADAHLAAVYAQCSTFGVVRDPLRRFVSQYFWITKAHHEPGPLCDREKFEAYANRTLQRLLEDPWIEDCHLVPQVHYVASHSGQRLCDHILHYEKLRSELSLLLKSYNLFDAKISLPVSNRGGAACPVEALRMSAALQQRIRDFFHLDYELGLGA